MGVDEKDGWFRADPRSRGGFARDARPGGSHLSGVFVGLPDAVTVEVTVKRGTGEGRGEGCRSVAEAV